MSHKKIVNDVHGSTIAWNKNTKWLDFSKAGTRNSLLAHQSQGVPNQFDLRVVPMDTNNYTAQESRTADLDPKPLLCLHICLFLGKANRLIFASRDNYLTTIRPLEQSAKSSS